MTPERWAQVKEVFGAALELPERDRATFLDSACGGDADLRAQVEQLLAASQGTGFESVMATLFPIAATLVPGDAVGPYRIEGKLGEGGMGVVYRAFDTRLLREVALKVLPPESLADPASKLWLIQEARAASALNHPNICTVHGLEESGAQPVIVMEVVHGETLAARLARGKLPVGLALAVAAQIADALIAAHGCGITHRDLKPANIMLTGPKGHPIVKVLDFGLAKMDRPPMETEAGTITDHGAILGTLHYMSPEQLEGTQPDARSDIFSFGLILYEMITGARPFAASSKAGTIAAILEREPAEFEPRWLSRLVCTCLAKDPQERFQTVRDLKRAIEWGDSGGEAASHALRRSRGWIPWAAAAALSAMAFLAGSRAGAPAVPVRRLALSIAQTGGSASAPIGKWPDISPDGSSVLYTAPGGLWVRRLDSLEPVLLRGTRSSLDSPFWLADSKTVAFRLNTGLFRVRVPDGAPEPIAKMQGNTRGGSCSDTGTILIALMGRLCQVPASGGEVKQVDTSAVKTGAFKYPQFLPGGDDFLFFLDPDEEDGAEVYLATLRDGKAINVSLLMKNETAAWYTPAGGGRLLYIREDDLYSRKLDRKRRKLDGDAELVQRGVASIPGQSFNRPAFSVSRSGTIAWRPGKPARNQVTAFDRHGREVGRAGPPGSFGWLALSPDETRLLANGDESWLLEPGQPGGLSLGKYWTWLQWTPDGSHLLGFQDSSGRLAERSVNVSDAREIAPTNLDLIGLQSVSSDGRQMLAMASRGGALTLDLQDFRMNRPSPRITPVPGPAGHAEFSPDNRWIVFSIGFGQTQERGIYVQPFPGPGLRKQITGTPGIPVWRKDGKEIIIADNRGVWSVRVKGAGGGLRFEAPELLFAGLRWPANYNLPANPLAVSRDGSRIYFAQALEQSDSNAIGILMGWAR